MGSKHRTQIPMLTWQALNQLSPLFHLKTHVCVIECLAQLQRRVDSVWPAILEISVGRIVSWSVMGAQWQQQRRGSSRGEQEAEQDGRNQGPGYTLRRYAPW